MREIRMHLISSVIPLIIVGCSSATLPTSSGELTVVQLAPEAGSVLGESSVLEVAFDYRIENFQQSATYGIGPLFADQRGSGRTFSAQYPVSKCFLSPHQKGASSSAIRFVVNGKPVTSFNRFKSGSFSYKKRDP